MLPPRDLLLLAQFLPRFPTTPAPLLEVEPTLLSRVLRLLPSLLKTSTRASSALSLLSLSSPPVQLPLAVRLLSSFPDPIPALALLHLSLAALPLYCAAAHALTPLRDSRFLSQRVLAFAVRTADRRVSPAHLLRLMATENRFHSTSQPTVLNLVFRAFLDNAMPAESMYVLARFRNAALSPPITAMSLLLRLLFRSGEPRTAWKVFDEMLLQGPRPSKFTFNAMILGHCLRGDAPIGEALLKVMRRFGCEPDASSYNIVAKAWCVRGRSGDVEQLLQLMEDDGHSPNIVTYNVWIHALCQEGRMERARRVFDSKIVRETSNTITYNVLLDGYVKAGQMEKAHELLEEMVRRGKPPDCYTFSILAGGYLKFQMPDGLRRLTNDVLCTRFPAKCSTTDVLVSALCWNGKLDQAKLVLSGLVDGGGSPSVFAFNSVIAGCSKAGLVEEAFGFFRSMSRQLGLVPSSSTFSLLIMGLCRTGRMREARELVDVMEGKGTRVNRSGYSMLVDGCFKSGDEEGARRVWRDMQRRGVAPDVISFSAFINGLCGLNCMDEAQEALSEMVSMGLVPNNFVYNSLINGFVRTGNLREAQNKVWEMKIHELTPDVFTNNIMINGYCMEGAMDMAQDIFKQMYISGLDPNMITYNTFIHAYLKARDYGGEKKIVELMSAKGREPDITTYNIWIHRLCTCRKMGEAAKMLDELLFIGILPNTLTYNTVLNGICMNLPHCALILTAKLIKLAFTPNVVTVNLLLSHFCKLGMAGRALIWAKRLDQASFPYDDATLNILRWASDVVQKGSSVSSAEDSGWAYFLESLMYMTYDSICRSRSAENTPLMISDVFGSSSKQM